MNSILIFSYYSNFPGACQAEWIDDKARNIITKGYEIKFISSTCCNAYNRKNISSWLVPSLSFFDYIDELKLLFQREKKVNFISFLWLPLIILVGLPLDFLALLLLKGNGEGRWSWFISSSLAGLTSLLTSKSKPNILISTGGPASAHLSGLIISKIFNIPLIVEFQDPLYGESVGRNSRSKFFLKQVESFIICFATKVVFATKYASSQAKLRHANLSHKIFDVYPGSWNFNVNSTNPTSYTHLAKYHNILNAKQNKKLKIIHLGSLYSTRNFDLLFCAIDELIAEGFIDSTDILVFNLGHVASEFKNAFKSRSYVSSDLPVPRKDALSIAATFDILLLVQNNDDRSALTIPYKTYDYINLGKPILGLLRSPELHQLLNTSSNYLADCGSISDIKSSLKKLYFDYSYSPICIQPSQYIIDSSDQTSKFLQLNF